MNCEEQEILHLQWDDERQSKGLSQVEPCLRRIQLHNYVKKKFVFCLMVHHRLVLHENREMK